MEERNAFVLLKTPSFHRIIRVLPSTSTGLALLRSLISKSQLKKMLRSSARLRSLSSSLIRRRFTSSSDSQPPPTGIFGTTTTPSDDAPWSSDSSWSTGFTKDQLEGEVIGRRQDDNNSSYLPHPPNHPPPPVTAIALSKWDKMVQSLEDIRRQGQGGSKKLFGGTLGDLMVEIPSFLKQAKEPGTRGYHLSEADKEKMYTLHKSNPEVYNVEKLAKDFKILRQRVHAILWLRKEKVEMEKKLGHPLNNPSDVAESIESNCREFHVASLPFKPDFKVMPEDWDGMPKDADEVHYEISKKEDDMLYEDFVQKFEFNMRKLKGEIKCHKYSRRRQDNGWNFTVEKLGARGKRGSGGGWKFVSLPDGSSRPLNDLEKLFLKRETNKWRRKLLPRKSSRKMFAAA